jgi:phytoene desaturase
MAASSSGSPTVVIGAGLAGLAAAVRLARAGHEVVLVEAGTAHGGCCSTTRSDGFVFNNGAVYVAVPSLLRHAFASLGLDFDAEVPMAAIAHPLESHLEDGGVVHLIDAARSHATGPREAERTRILRGGLMRIQRDWAPVYRALVDHVLPRGPSPWNAVYRLGRHLPKLRGDVASVIRRYFPDAGVQAAVGSLLLYTGTAPERLPAGQIIGLLALLEEGFHLPHGGMGAISDALLRHARASGVTIHLGQRVDRIEITRGGASGVVLGSGERLATSRILSTLSGFELSRCLLAPGAAPRKLARVARRAPLSHRAISIQIGARTAGDEGSFIVNHVPALDRQALVHQLPPDTPEWLSYTVPTRVLDDISPPARTVIECFAPVPEGTTALAWTSRQTGSIVEQYVDGLMARLPGLAIETLRVTDPAGFHLRRHLYQGALYGVAPGAPPHQLFPHRSGMDGLYLAGQTTFPGYGVATATMSGLQAAAAMLRDERARTRH